ncbi:MAG: transcription termination factor NusA [Candidatus Chisholmbacteria bacterium RIFCSPHIGHO2_01_FULL_49_18]|uniref:Transcription termination/antitermination protein NusA n=1 Tax=Candidatus Chisholmbacteria bacterium RIFCSPHIGHO2_01_FULL_49_18 TaxID=1797590 RepID=A0A1G1VLS7_9BACT|nr:MAG: transcription termination factor NusA [Candidatus Chisholmbacteria bacterium RIFCSPHIGHO2_01_FULL_49_18]
MAPQTTARTEFAAALNQICAERGIEPEVVLDTIKAAIIAAYRKDYGIDEEIEYEVEIDATTGAARIFKNVGKKKEDITPPGFGRIAAQTAKQVILQRVREAEKDAIISEYTEKVGSIINGMVLRFDGPNIIIDIGRGQGTMPPQEQIQSERYKLNQRLVFFIADIRETMKGKTIIVSRTHPGLVEQLFAREVPEVASKAVEIKAVAREGGMRTKIAVDSTQEGVDPVGSCVGQRGIRVQAVINELAGEKIDIIQYSQKPEAFIASALAPAEGIKVELDEERKKAVVTVPDDQLSLAIGRGGQNVRLAAKLTEYKIDIQGESGEKAISVTGKEEYEIDSLGLSSRVRNALVAANILNTEQLKGKSKKDLKAIKGLGPKAIAEILEKLK